ncbi:MAG: tyrosine-type recombinase/integrase [Acidimicrobiia bacterium]
MASIRKRDLATGGVAYLVRFRGPDGKERSRQFKRKRDAENYANSIEVDRAQGTVIDPRLGRITVTEWFERWWPTVTDLRPTTYARDEQYFRTHVLPVFGNVPLARLDRTDLRQFVADLSAPKDAGGSGLAPATVQKVIQVFNKVMRSAEEDRLISHNPVDGLPLPRVEREEMRFVTADELWRLADTIDPRYRSFVLLAGYGGLRLGELLGLRWSRVNLLRREVEVAETLIELKGHFTSGPPKTRAAVRTVSVPGFVCDELALLATAHGDRNSLVFQSPDGYPIRASLFRRRFWTPAVKAAGLAPLRIHDLRHSAVSLWIAAGANPKQVAVRAGHTSVSVVFDRYGHLYPKHDDDLITALEARRPASAQR